MRRVRGRDGVRARTAFSTRLRGAGRAQATRRSRCRPSAARCCTGHAAAPNTAPRRGDMALLDMARVPLLRGRHHARSPSAAAAAPARPAAAAARSPRQAAVYSACPRSARSSRACAPARRAEMPAASRVVLAALRDDPALQSDPAGREPRRRAGRRARRGLHAARARPPHRRRHARRRRLPARLPAAADRRRRDVRICKLRTGAKLLGAGRDGRARLLLHGAAAQRALADPASAAMLDAEALAAARGGRVRLEDVVVVTAAALAT